MYSGRPVSITTIRPQCGLERRNNIVKCKCKNTAHGHGDPCEATRNEDLMCEDCHKAATKESAATEPGNPPYVPR